METEREVLVQKTRLLGAEHKQTLVAACNLGFSLSECGQKTEAEQLLRGTLAPDGSAHALSSSRAYAVSVSAASLLSSAGVKVPVFAFATSRRRTE